MIPFIPTLKVRETGAEQAKMNNAMQEQKIHPSSAFWFCSDSQ